MARAKKKDKKVLYPTLTAIPRCKVGDCVFRQTLIGQYEEAMIVSILSPDETSDSWSGTLMTKNGIEYIAGYVEHRTIHDWMPIGWVYDNEAVGWWPPASIYFRCSDSVGRREVYVLAIPRAEVCPRH